MDASDLERFRAGLADRYRLERELGAGGMATVYLATDLRHHRQVAIKVMRPEVARAFGVERFLAEIRTTAGLQHPHLLPLHDSGELADTLYYVMPYVAGETLAVRLEREKQLPVDQAVRITRQVAGALDYVHRQGFAHRDIKPENILLADDQAFLADLGIALTLHAPAASRLTATGMSLGTPAYMSPEQAAGSRDLDARTDIYALGAVCYELLTGEPPHSGTTARALIAKVISETPTAIGALRPGVSPPIERAVTRALAKVPADRFSTAGEFAVALEAAMTPAAAPRRRSSVRSTMLITLAGLAVVAAYLVLRLDDDAPLNPRRVAVAVFTNRTGEAGLESIGTMAADWVSRALTRMSSIEVVEPATLYTQGRTARGEVVDPLTLAQANGAGLVVIGSYYRSGDSLYFGANISEAASGKVRHALEPVAAPVANGLRGVEVLRERITAALATVVDPSEVFNRAAELPSQEAYLEFVLGQEVYWQGDFQAGLKRFRRAFELDSTFLTATGFAGVAAVALERCDLTDSIGQFLDRRLGALPEPERIRLRLLQLTSWTRCRSEWDEQVASQEQRLKLEPGSGFVRWALAAGARRAHRPALAVKALTHLDPQRDLGWISDSAKVFYWRELAAAQHVLGDYRAELAIADRIEDAAPGRLAAAFFATRALAGAGRGTGAIERLAGVEAKDSDPPLVAGEIARRRDPRLIGSPGWVLYQAATELDAHGLPDLAKAVASRALAWYQTRSASEAATPESRIIRTNVLAFLGRFDEANREARALAAEDSLDIDARGTLGLVAASRRDTATAAVIDRWLELLQRPYPIWLPVLYRGRMAALAGATDSALALLGRMKYHAIDPVLFHSDPWLAALRGDPRFEALLRPRN